MPEEHRTVVVASDRVTRHFLELVQIDSPSFEEQQIAERLRHELEDLGLRVSLDGSGPGGTGNLIGRWPGDTGLPIALFAHLDTVEPGRGIQPRVDRGVIRSDGTTVLGADCKAGIAAIVEALRIVREQNLPHGPVEVVFTYGEERGHAGAKSLRLDDLQASIALVADAPGLPGTIVGQAPSYESFRAIFHGQAAHAGLEPEKGLSAIQLAAEAIRRLPLGRIDAETTANVGLIRGGTARNAVPGRVEIEGEARSLTDTTLDSVVADLKRSLENATLALGGRVEHVFTREYRAYHLAEDHPGIALALRAARTLGLGGQLTAMGGGSDANTLNERGLPAVALGIGMQQPHTLQEWIAVEDLAGAAQYFVALIGEAAVTSA